MKTSLKKILTSLILSGSLAVSLVPVSAATYDTKGTWSARHVNQAGATAANVTGRVSLQYCTTGAMVYCKSSSHTANGATGTTTIRCANYTMTAKKIKDIGKAFVKPTVSGSVKCITYTFYAYSDTQNDVFNVSGTIVNKS